MKQVFIDNIDQLLSLPTEELGILYTAMLLYLNGHTSKINDAKLQGVLEKWIKLNSNDINSRMIRFGKQLSEVCPNEPKETLRAFYDYWTEHNSNGKKMRWEMEKVFDITKRMATWNKNNTKFKGLPVKEGEGVVFSNKWQS